MDESLLRQIEHWRADLAHNMARRNLQLPQSDIHLAVQETIDRIVFLRICEDRGIEPRGQLQSLVSGGRIYARLCELSRRADERYSSGLFHFAGKKNHAEAADEWTLSLEVDDRVLAEILGSLYSPASPHEFSTLGADILGRIYEQFLGKIVRLTKARQVKVEDNPEVKKTGGVYYTPVYIVDYIVRQTVGGLLKGKDPHQAAGRTQADCTRSIHGQPLAVVDPACGSGSFLIGVYQYLLDWYGNWYLEHDPASHQGRVFQTRAHEWRLTATERRRILLDHIYGVDIDPQAVGVTRRSLLLKLLEGEGRESPVQPMRQHHKPALPDLEENIKCGNSLIGSGFTADTKRDTFSNEAQRRDNNFDWDREFPCIANAGGFDAVIGNPPYRRERDYRHEMDKISASDFGRKYRSPRMDLWYYFVHRGLELLKPDAPLSFIVNAYWTAGTGAEKLIRAMTEDSHVDEIFFLEKLKVFQRVSGQHLVFRLTKGPSDAGTTIKRVVPEGEPTAEPFILGTARVAEFTKTRAQLFAGGRVDLQEPADGLLARLELHDRLECLGEIRQGIAENPASVNPKTNRKYDERWTVGEGVFALTTEEVRRLKLPEQERRLLRPYHDLCDLGRYYLAEEPSLTLIYSTKQTCPEIGEYPVLKNHLDRFRPIMEARRETRKQSNCWWHLHWPREERLWQTPKIISVQMGSRPGFVSAIAPAYVPFSANVFVPHASIRESLLYFAGILNSRLLWKWYQHRAKRRGAGLEINGHVLARSPVRRIDFENPAEVKSHDRLVELVGQMLRLNIRCRAANRTSGQTELTCQIGAMDREIDALVYDLYGLPDEEVRIVEEATGQ